MDDDTKQAITQAIAKTAEEAFDAGEFRGTVMANLKHLLEDFAVLKLWMTKSEQDRQDFEIKCSACEQKIKALQNNRLKHYSISAGTGGAGMALIYLVIEIIKVV